MRKKKNKINPVSGGKKEFFINLLIIFVTAFFGISLIKNIERVAKAKQQIADVAQAVEKLQKQNMELKERLNEVDSQAFVETQLRDKLGLAKPGETVVVLPDPEILKKLAPINVYQPPALPEANWEKWYKLFF